MNKNIEVSKGTVIRTAVLGLAIVNNALAIAGKSPLPVDDETLASAISFGFTTAASLVTWWKNNSFTSPAIEADHFKDELIEDARVEREGE
ncbi:MAG: phage holin [Lachnospiraceae bacterium]|nr:phage holin [Lachnospiraceae bacterium]